MILRDIIIQWCFSDNYAVDKIINYFMSFR